MKKFCILALLTLVAAGLSVFNIVDFRLANLMRSLHPATDIATYVSLAVILAASVAAIMMARHPARMSWFGAVLALMISAGFAPRVVDNHLRSMAAQRAQDERRDIEAKFLALLEAFRKEISVRIAERRPFSGRDAQALIEFVQGSDFGSRDLPDQSPVAFALLKRALDAKILDPNVRVKGPRIVDVSEEPLFVAYYKFYLQSGVAMKRVREREWTLLQMLVAAGANLDDPAAAVLKNDVTRKTAPHELKGYLSIK